MGTSIQSADQTFTAGGLVVPLIVPAALGRRGRTRSTTARSPPSAGMRSRGGWRSPSRTPTSTVIVEHRVIAADVNARDTARAHAAYAEKQYAGGAVSRLDAVRAGQQWHTAEALVNDAEVALIAAEEALGVLVAGDRPIDAAETPTFPLPATRENPERLARRHPGAGGAPRGRATPGARQLDRLHALADRHVRSAIQRPGDDLSAPLGLAGAAASGAAAVRGRPALRATARATGASRRSGDAAGRA